MTRTATFEAIIEIASKMKDSLAELFRLYDGLPAVISKEHEAIRVADFVGLKTIGAEKDALGGEIEAAFKQLRIQTNRLVEWHGRLCGGPPKNTASISECRQLLREIRGEITSTGLGTQVLDHLEKGIAALAEKFQDRMEKVKPLVEMNKYLLGKLLDNYRESYRFWQEIAVEAASPYDASGTQKAKGTRSVLQVRA